MGNSWDSNYLNVTGSDIHSANEIFAAPCDTLMKWLNDAYVMRTDIMNGLKDASKTSVVSLLDVNNYIDSILLAIQRKKCEGVNEGGNKVPPPPPMPPIHNSGSYNTGVVSPNKGGSDVPMPPITRENYSMPRMNGNPEIVYSNASAVKKNNHEDNGWGFHGIASSISASIASFFNRDDEKTDDAATVTPVTPATPTVMKAKKPKKTFMKWLITGMKK